MKKIKGEKKKKDVSEQKQEKKIWVCIWNFYSIYKVFWLVQIVLCF